MTDAHATDGDDRLAPDGLSLSIDAPDRLEGQFRDLAGEALSFRAIEESSRVRVDLTVGDLDIMLVRDVASGQARWSGGGQRMTAAAQTSLLALSTATARQWTPDREAGAPALPLLKDVMVRLVALVAEAPIGIVLADQLVERALEPGDSTTGAATVSRNAHLSALDGSAGVRSSAVWSAATAAACQLELLGAGVFASIVGGGRATAPQACQVADDDGIAYMNCSTTTRTLWHDAGGHCFLSERIWSGPDSGDCMGRCGAGCGAWGGGIYTYDCGEHDRCGRVHGGSLNPWDAECGDEYWDADDDFIWGWPNCPWG